MKDYKIELTKKDVLTSDFLSNLMKIDRRLYTYWYEGKKDIIFYTENSGKRESFWFYFSPEMNSVGIYLDKDKKNKDNWKLFSCIEKYLPEDKKDFHSVLLRELNDGNFDLLVKGQE